MARDNPADQASERRYQKVSRATRTVQKEKGTITFTERKCQVEGERQEAIETCQEVSRVIVGARTMVTAVVETMNDARWIAQRVMEAVRLT